jgi:predicted nucleic acid-binding protein
MSLADAQIGGICMVGRHELATRNVGDFSTASALALTAPFQQ